MSTKNLDKCRQKFWINVDKKIWTNVDKKIGQMSTKRSGQVSTKRFIQMSTKRFGQMSTKKIWTNVDKNGTNIGRAHTGSGIGQMGPEVGGLIGLAIVSLCCLPVITILDPVGPVDFSPHISNYFAYLLMLVLSTLFPHPPKKREKFHRIEIKNLLTLSLVVKLVTSSDVDDWSV